ncbi:Amidohydrolase family protein [Frankia canadensis]|uniref:Amidohydrolase family protein n=1 Tax=Frankia canadensis TaxID=1836972 RepID=A0A2I2KNQ5_9ACTN|nr:amidohydrolase family protein [Frankia canadensis]SNQ47298.1 Amidohydrolase family protein [Frankia canadensis]SOU54588.1 Amidohydrolase family protein [Frankia canadensis]
MSEPRIISVDDHILEPGDLWTARLPERFRERAPRLARRRGSYGNGPRSPWTLDDDGLWADVWEFEGLVMPILPGFAAAGKDHEYLGEHWDAMLYDDMIPGCYEQGARLADMDVNRTEASLSFPTFPRFCGQTFLERGDRDLGLACLRVYNDWMIDEWCGGAGRGRLIPLTLIPLWDPQLAAAEVRRCAAKGSHAVCFSENPSLLRADGERLPSIHTTHWDPFFAACEETETVVNLHIGSSSTFPVTSLDAPRAVSLALTYQGSAHALADWLTCGVLERFQTLKVALSEGQVGWMPFLIEKLDGIWHDRPVYGNLNGRLTRPPSHYIPGRLYGCVFDDVVGLRLRDRIGMEQIMFEVDYPHGDSTWPNTGAVFDKIVTAAGLDEREAYLLARGNAIACYGLERFGITA